MTRASSLAFVLAIGCGPLVAVDDGTGEESGSRDDGGEDRPGTGPRPTTITTPESGPDDGEGDGEVDEGWKPDFEGGHACDASAIASCYSEQVLAVPDEALQVLVEDVVGDEWPDLVVASQYAIFVYPGEGGSWSDPIASPTMIEAPTGIASLDVDLDGDLDLAIVDGSPSVVFAVGGDVGVFSSVSASAVPGMPMHLRARDIDGDAVIEPIVALEDGTIAIVRDLGGPMPPIEILDSGIWQVEAFEVAELGLSGAGDDLIVAGRNSDQVLLAVASHESAIEGVWQVRSFAGGSVGLVVRDLDGDGVQDVATATSSETVAELYRGQGDGTFTTAPVLELGDTASAVAGGRFGPGIEGMVVIVGSTPTIVDFASGLVASLTDQWARGPLAVGDYNGDGISDIVSPTSDGTGVLVLWSVL